MYSSVVTLVILDSKFLVCMNSGDARQLLSALVILDSKSLESSRQNKHKLQYSSASPLPALAFEEIHVLAASYNPFATCDSCYQPGWCAREELQWVKHLNPRIMDLRSIITVSSDSSGIQDQMVEVSQPCTISFIYQGLAFPLFEAPTEGLFVGADSDMPPLRNNNHGDRGLEIKFYDPANASGTRARRIMRQEFTILAAANSTTFCFYKPPGSSQQALPLSSQSVSPQEHGLPSPPPPPPPSPPPPPPPHLHLLLHLHYHYQLYFPHHRHHLQHTTMLPVKSDGLSVENSVSVIHLPQSVMVIVIVGMRGNHDPISSILGDKWEGHEVEGSGGKNFNSNDSDGLRAQALLSMGDRQESTVSRLSLSDLGIQDHGEAVITSSLMDLHVEEVSLSPVYYVNHLSQPMCPPRKSSPPSLCQDRCLKRISDVTRAYLSSTSMSIFGGWDDFKAQCKTNVLYAHAILQSLTARRVDEPTVILDVKNWTYPLPRTSLIKTPGSLSLIDDSSQQDFAVRQHHTLKESKTVMTCEMELCHSQTYTLQACGTSLVEMSHVIGFAKLSSQMAKTMSLRGPLDIEQLVVDMIDGSRIEYFAHLLVIPESEIGLVNGKVGIVALQTGTKGSPYPLLQKEFRNQRSDIPYTSAMLSLDGIDLIDDEQDKLFTMYSIDTVHTSYLAAKSRVRQYTYLVTLLKHAEDSWAQRLQEAGYVVMDQSLRRVALDGIEVEDDEQDVLLKFTTDTVFANYIAAQQRVRQYTQFLIILRREEDAWAQRLEKVSCIMLDYNPASCQSVTVHQ
ncbi:hypothetical protein BD769DRAFT_1396345 [Suillus cothurnatus]|nr:hypothetical protein BD769DRAFT_1396345 [Suillus cothurnatus]